MIYSNLLFRIVRIPPYVPHIHLRDIIVYHNIPIVVRYKMLRTNVFPCGVTCPVYYRGIIYMY